MGWTTCFSATEWKWVGGRKVVDRQKECDKMFNWESKDKDGNIISTHRILKSAMVGSTYYAAVETKKVGEEPKVWAAVVLTVGKGSDGTLWGYKDMAEDWGPNEDRCPASILALLTPTDNEHSLDWRNRCRENIRRKAEERKNGPTPIYTPKGVRIWVEGKSWLISSDYYTKTTYFRACRFSKAKWREADVAVRAFLEHYGTDEQKAEYAASGRRCNPQWKMGAA